jgi:hypothetical protein
VKLTMPSYDHGAARIMVDGRQVGYALARNRDWRAYLWTTPDVMQHPPAETITLPTLGDLRAHLRRRLADQGRWWTTPKEDQ